MLLSSAWAPPARYISPLTCACGLVRAGRCPGTSRLPARLPGNRPARLPGQTPASPATRDTGPGDTGRETRVTWQPAEVPGSGRRRGPARAGRARIPSRRAGPAGLPPGTSSIHARLGASGQVRPRAAARPGPAPRLRPAPRQETMPPPHQPGSSLPAGGMDPRTYRNRGNGPVFHAQHLDRYLAASGHVRHPSLHLRKPPGSGAVRRLSGAGHGTMNQNRLTYLNPASRPLFGTHRPLFLRKPPPDHHASLRPETPPTSINPVSRPLFGTHPNRQPSSPPICGQTGGRRVTATAVTAATVP